MLHINTQIFSLFHYFINMNYLHTMIRNADLDKTLSFYIYKLGLKEIRRYENHEGRFTLVFICAPEDIDFVRKKQAPLIEITYNQPYENSKTENFKAGRSFGHIAFSVNNLYQTCERLMDGGVEINRPPRNGYMAFIKSPDNISIELLQKGNPLPPKEPWKCMSNKGIW